MLKLTPPKINRIERTSATQDISIRPTANQYPPGAPPSNNIRNNLPTMETGSTCRRNPRIATVR
jgi:hypothetical protein